MKQLLLSIFFLAFALTGKAQQSNETSYYYFGKQKIYLQQSSEKIYLRLPAEEVVDMKAGLRNTFSVSEKAFTHLQANRFILINLKDNTASRSEAIRDFIKNTGKAELVRPALIAPDGKDVVIDEGFYVKLKPGISYAQLADLAGQKKCVIEKVYAYNNKTYLLRAGAANNYDGLKMANVFYEAGLFEYAEPDFRLLDALSSVPNDPLFNLQWAAVNTGAANQGSGTVGADIDLDEAWDITMGSPSVRIAVLDEGIQRTHPDLVNNIDPLGFGLVAGNATTGNILSTTRSHGTSCGGIIAAEANNNIGVAGVAPLSKLIPVNITVNTTGTFGTSAQIAQATDWAWDQGAADILSNSWGGGTPSSLIQDAIRRAVTLGRGGKGAIVLFSSGNNNAGLSSPACFPETIAVGAMSMCYERKSGTSCDGETFWGGNYGTGLDIAAPGVRIATTRVTGTGTAPNADYNLAFNGTSSSTPVVAGVAALVLAVNNNFTQQQVREILERSTKKVGSYPYSFVPGQPNGSWTSELGHGMVNAKNAVLAAQNPAFCRVDIAAGGDLQVCSGSNVPLLVTNNVSGNSYEWRRDGNIAGAGINFSATQSGNYDVILTTGSGCKDTSYSIAVVVSVAQGALVTDAGRDTSICLDTKIFLGGGPAGSGGTGIIHPMRAIASDIANNLLLRFDPLQPSLNYSIIKSPLIPSPQTDEFYSGAAATPYGLYAINRISKMLVKIDTANGNTYEVGLTTNSSVSFTGMTYDPSTNKIFAAGTSGTSNHLFEINRITGEATFINTITGIAASNVLISLSADNSGQLYGLRLSTVLNVSAQLMYINKTTGAATVAGNTGFLANFAQSGDVDPLTDELYQAAGTSVLGSTASYNGKGLWKLNKITGFATLVGSVAQPFNTPDAMSFANKEYKYQWSPATNLSNANDANPQFTATAAGTFIYTLTVTDLCGNTATDQVTIVVNNLPPIPVISPANPVLSHRNAFTTTLSYTQQGGLDYTWVQDGIVQPNTTNSFPVSFANSTFSQFTVRVTNAATGCVGNSAPVAFTYSPGVLLNSNTALTVCDSSFYDAGGPAGLTGNNFTKTFTPSTPGSKLKLSFYSLQLPQFGTLFIYDGPDANSPRIEALDNSFNGNTLREFTASNPDGVLTVRYSIGSTSSAGWLAGITCEQPLQFRTISNGNWIATGIWESKLPASGTWLPATRLPNKGDDLITVRHDVGLNQPLQIDDVVVSSTGKININGSGYFNLYKVKPVTELIVETGGTVQVANSSFIFGSGKIELQGTLQNDGAITVDELLVNGTTPQQIINTTGTPTEITKLSMNNAAGLTVQGFHKIGTLQLINGLINTSAGNTLVLENNTAGNAASYVNGMVRFLGKSGMNNTIPIGKAGAYRPIVLSAGSADGEGSALLQAEVITGAPAVRSFPAGINNVSNIRYYQVSPIENSVNLRDFTITLPYGTDDAVTDHTILKIAKDDGAGAWINLGGTATGAAPGTITSDGFNSFSDFVLANVLAGPLPVTLISFSGSLQNNTALLNWTAENEINFSRYEIERSSTGTDFSTIGSVNAAGSGQTVNYNFIDDQLPAGSILYYRLKMVDIDGQFRYSNIIRLKKEAIAQSRLLSLAPNPFENKLTIQYESSSKEKITGAVFNSQGQLIKTISFTVQEGINQLYLDGSKLAAGVYLLQLKTNDQVIVQKIIKQ
jgi:hypothetical protein